VSRWSSARVAPLTAGAIAINLVLIGVAPSWLALAGALFVAGSLDAIGDVANNAHALRVERRYGRSILVSLHATWSIGAVVGTGMGMLALALDVPVATHLLVAAVLLGAVPVVVRRRLLPGHDAVERPAAASSAGGPARWRSWPVLGALGLIAGSAQLIEDTTFTWSASYLREDLGAAATLGGLGFIALQACQVVGRLLGDRVVNRYGDRAVARTGASVGCAAITAALAAPGPTITVAALGVLGLCIGTFIPASVRRADSLPGLPAGAGIMVVGTVSRLGMLAAPPLVGVVADATSLRRALVVLPLAAGLVVLLARVLPAHAPAAAGLSPAATPPAPR
jgi:hypothetical protein